MTEYEQGSSPVFYVTFADANGEPASVTSGTIAIRHRYGSSTTTDVNDELLTQLNGSTYYYGGWSIPSSADRTVYDVRYIGTYSDGTIAIGDETFYVIGRSFFDKRGGGMVKTVTKRDTWTNEEKENLLSAISELARKHNIETELSQSAITELKSGLNGISTNLVSFSDNFINLTDKVSQNAKKNDIESSNRGIEEVKVVAKKAIELVEAQQQIINETSRAIKETSAKDKTREESAAKEIYALSKAISDLGLVLRNERLGHIISELDDLKMESGELKKLVVMTASREVLELTKSGITEINRR